MTFLKNVTTDQAPHILVCEDMKTFAEGMIEGLKENYPNAVIDWAPNLASAVELVKANHYNLIITDYEYPSSYGINKDTTAAEFEGKVEYYTYDEGGFSEKQLKPDWSALESPWREMFEKSEGYSESIKHPIWERFGSDSSKLYSGGMLIRMLRSGILGYDKRDTPVVLQSGHVNKEALVELLAPKLEHTENKTAFILKEVFSESEAMLAYPVVLHSGNLHLHADNYNTVESNFGHITQGWSNRKEGPGLFSFTDGTVSDKYEGTVSKTRFIRAFKMALQGLGLNPETLIDGHKGQLR